jgi:cobalamin synthase
LWLGVTPGVTAVLVLALGAMLTGGLHEDGLSDTADGLFGGWTRDRRLEIMKDTGRQLRRAGAGAGHAGALVGADGASGLCRATIGRHWSQPGPSAARRWRW